MDNSEVKTFVQAKGKNYRVKRVQNSAPSKTCLGEQIIGKLKPLQFAMVKGLQRKGISTFGMKFKTVVAVYYNEFSGNTINVSDFINNVAFKVFNADDISGQLINVRVQNSIRELNEIVEAIINIFKTSKNKYDVAVSYGYDPEKMLKDEEIYQAKATKIVEFDLLKKFKSDHYMKASEFNYSIKWILGFFLVLYLFYIWD